MSFALPLELIGLTVVAILAAGFTIMWIVSSRYVLVGPNEVLIISGLKRRVNDPDGTARVVGYRIVKGGGAFVWPIIEKYERLSLELMTLEITNPEVYTQAGVPINVDGIAQIKVRGEDVAIATAAEQFLSKGDEEIRKTALHTLEGHLRAIVGTLSVEKIYQDREAFAQKVQEVAATDMAHMGLQIVSFTIRNIHDKQGYLEALGRPRIAEVKKIAAIAQAEADRDAHIKAAEANQKAMEAKLLAETRIAESRASFERQQAQYTVEVNAKKADADMAYDLEKNKVAQLVKAEEMKILIVQKEKDIEIWNKEVARKHEELTVNVHKPAEAEKYRIQMMAQAERERIQALAAGEAEATRARGTAEADVRQLQGAADAQVVKATGNAEAEAMAKKAEAWQSYNQAAVLQLVLEKLPEIAKYIAEPLSKMDKMVVISNGNSPDGGTGASKVTQDIINVIAQLPPAVEALTKINLQDVLSRIPGLQEGMDKKKGA